MNNQKTSPKDFFLHLGAIVALYYSAIALLNLLFTVINYKFPDALSYSDIRSSSFFLASLIIVFPVFLILSWLLNKDYVSFPEKLDLPVRRWLTTITLFVAGLVIAGDLVVLINTYLRGEITTRFVYKVLAVLVITAVIFGYYIMDLRDRTNRRSRNKLFAIISIVIVLGSLVIGFIVMGSPTTQRLRRFDEQKISDLQNVQYEILNYWNAKATVPTSFNDLKDPLFGYDTPVDPQGGQYTYSKKSNSSFEICADFNLDSNNSGINQYGRPYSGEFKEPENWKHGKGKTCFTRTIDPTRYPPQKLPAASVR
ncbi:hypothetical protein KW783_01085 [Candidatus Parcubacteria bacterium]|nr:hypothetical protein [Candidatus Parcubacteria bacterium]